MPKNIVICCDGTSNKLSLNENTNVVHIYSCLTKSKDQITYYNPGVGTLAPTTFKRNYRKLIYKLSDMFTARTLNDRVKDAYVYLMNHYEEGDQIYLFGFSRGAYTVRMLAGMIKMYGILYSGNESHIEYIFHDYGKIGVDPLKSEKNRFFGLANRIRHSFSHKSDIHFMGIWDTVVSIGNLTSWYRPFPYTDSLEGVKTVRHAIAIDEKRKHYHPFRVNSDHKDCKEVWFAGVHSDVGGSYTKEGLSKIALEWMLGEASQYGLILDKSRVDRYLYGKNSNYQKPDFTQNIEKSDTWIFKIADILPRPSYDPKNGFYLDGRFSAVREIEDNALIHETVIKKKAHDEGGHIYIPKNLGSHGKYIEVKSLDIKYTYIK